MIEVQVISMDGSIIMERRYPGSDVDDACLKAAAYVELELITEGENFLVGGELLPPIDLPFWSK